jgi:hypothetical protein
MRTTINIDDDLLAAASAAIGVSERSVVLHEGLKSLIQREAARRLARLGGGSPGLVAIPRRRSPPAARKRSKAK